MADEMRLVLGFTGLELTTGFDTATIGSLRYKVKDHPTNADRHAVLLGQLLKSTLILSLDNGKFTVTVKESNNGNFEP